MANWIKLPGLFYRWEFEDVVEVDGEHEYRFELAGRDDRSRDLVAIWCRIRTSGSSLQPAETPPARPAPAVVRGVA